jgi:hypothetical protein
MSARQPIDAESQAQEAVQPVKRALDAIKCIGPLEVALIASYLTEAVHKSGWSHDAAAIDAIERLGDVDHVCRKLSEKQN